MAKPDKDQIDRPQEPEAEIEELMTQLARELGKNARVEVVFGQPVERDHATVIPVATASLGLGGGSGSGKASRRAHTLGVGLGGGLRMAPVGFIAMADGKVRFRRILPTWAFVTIALGIGTLGSMLLLLRRL